MAVIAWIVLGLVCGGAVALTLGRRGRGLLLELALGVCGALAAAGLFTGFGAAGVVSVDLYTALVSVIGALLALFVVHAILATSKV